MLSRRRHFSFIFHSSIPHMSVGINSLTIQVFTQAMKSAYKYDPKRMFAIQVYLERMSPFLEKRVSSCLCISPHVFSVERLRELGCTLYASLDKLPGDSSWIFIIQTWDTHSKVYNPLYHVAAGQTAASTSSKKYCFSIYTHNYSRKMLQTHLCPFF